MALWNKGVKEKYLTPVEWEILLCLLFSAKNRSCLTTNIEIIIIIIIIINKLRSCQYYMLDCNYTCKTV